MTNPNSDVVRIGVVDGDGIGPEIVPVAVEIASAAAQRAGLTVEWVRLAMGQSAIAADGDPLPQKTIDALDELDCWILGPHDSAGYPAEFRSGLTPGAIIRKRYGLFANLRPAWAYPGVPAVADDIDVLIVRENSEGLYADRNMALGSGEFMPTQDVALAVGLITRAASERIAKVAFEQARRRRKHVTVVHKANVLTMTTGLFREACFDVARDYPDVVVDEQHVDAMAALLVRRAGDFDVVVTENLFGDILSDLAAELAGSLGLAASINASTDKAMAQAAHGAAPDIAGQDRANPVAIIESTAMLFDWWTQRFDDERGSRAAALMRSALGETLQAGASTPDLGGNLGTTAFGVAVQERIG
ncbi:MAG TPA: isocitrate/isopropylmalate family dehydrogenase [Gordonia sp. (in: high G+C Gram-positive bacteria)]|uniref:isocitrate/isopropylmalate dehydrogenase family protein n=1 Tax=unclassified Gordonia (in: high G+C Gram-positive bacteria) TaxID=2657482 RepID=UPI0025BA63CE|nr:MULTISPECIES: isocitrate/isopropylmalate family dehydrogenase [unclassified Gordonia (in: high G+C Gram-positive bacteria)]HNP58016.1 isocitrate/isopropylmalate family dehydrogenase [Gordonia sp. (in: high G+C Gram-positive bacteria)]HRC52865.1 isocitrate/isopropylmalate family dehydrogenase [Gordonia sp. (in: high G+C Gram-positive bacteria)]